MSHRVLQVAGIVALVPALAFAADELRGPASLRVTSRGVGPITQSTPFDEKVLRKLLPGFTVTAGEDVSEGEFVAHNLKVSWRGNPVLVVHQNEIVGKVIRSVEVVSSLVRGPNGEHVGDTFAAIGRPLSSCALGMEETDGFVFCSPSDVPSLSYEADASALPEGAWPEPDEKPPPSDVLPRLKISSIFWMPRG